MQWMHLYYHPTLCTLIQTVDLLVELWNHWAWASSPLLRHDKLLLSSVDHLQFLLPNAIRIWYFPTLPSVPVEWYLMLEFTFPWLLMTLIMTYENVFSYAYWTFECQIFYLFFNELIYHSSKCGCTHSDVHASKKPLLTISYLPLK